MTAGRLNHDAVRKFSHTLRALCFGVGRVRSPDILYSAGPPVFGNNVRMRTFSKHSLVALKPVGLNARVAITPSFPSRRSHPFRLYTSTMPEYFVRQAYRNRREDAIEADYRDVGIPAEEHAVPALRAQRSSCSSLFSGWLAHIWGNGGGGSCEGMHLSKDTYAYDSLWLRTLCAPRLRMASTCSTKRRRTVCTSPLRIQHTTHIVIAKGKSEIEMCALNRAG